MSDSNKSIRWGYLPDEILTRIFTFLPIKCVIICTSVSKTWKNLIQNSTFISTHLHHSHNNNKNNLLLFRLSRNNKQVYTLHKEDADPDFTEYTSFDFPFHGPHLQQHHLKVVGTCDGLLCLSDGLPDCGSELFLWNPCIRKLLQLPIPRINFNTENTSHLWQVSFGFGFDSKTNDYKVVRFLSVCRSPLGFGKSPPVVEVYSVFAGEWRMLSASASLPPICALINSGPPTFANGALHWIASSYSSTHTRGDRHFVLVFDLGDEVFRQILLPQIPSDMEKWMWTCVFVYGNSIAGFLLDFMIGQIKMWVMKEDGATSSWTNCSHQYRSLGRLQPCPVGFRRNGEVILLNTGGQLFSWNPDSQNIKNLGINGYFDTFYGSYVESLVLLDKATKGVVTY